jgi:glycosyltransferase involved in cell wall biosynthesis
MSENKRLKILFLPAWYPSEVNQVSGIFVKEHARAASLYNDIVVLYAYPDPCPKLWKLYRLTEESEDGIRTIRIRHEGVFFYLRRKLYIEGQTKGASSALGSSSAAPLRKLLRIPNMIVEDLLYYWSIFATFRRLVNEGWKPDIIHAHVYSAGVPAVILGKKYKIPVVISEHCSAFPRHLLNFWGRKKAQFAMNRVNIIFPVSKNLEEAIRSYGIKNKFEVTPNVVNTKIFYPSREKRNKNDKKRILFVGLLTPVKGIPYLLKALSQLKQKRQDFILDIVGDGPNKEEYEELTRDIGLDEIVKFHGLKIKKEVAKFMRNCDFFVLPSFYENFGVVYIEAMACGKPVIGTNAGGSREIITKQTGLLVPPKNVNALIKAINYMLDHYQNYSSEKISQYTRNNFSYEVIGKKLNEIYKNILGKINYGQSR